MSYPTSHGNVSFKIQAFIIFASTGVTEKSLQVSDWDTKECIYATSCFTKRRASYIHVQEFTHQQISADEHQLETRRRMTTSTNDHYRTKLGTCIYIVYYNIAHWMAHYVLHIIWYIRRINLYLNIRTKVSDEKITY